MIKIDKSFRDWLVEEKGVPCGENGVSRTYGKHKSYYMCESSRNLRLKKEYDEMIRKTK